MGKAIRNLREMVEKNNLVIRDVYPDGNCMFGTVVDQLRVRGDFTYTTQSLRKEVVDYFRKNPTAVSCSSFRNKQVQSMKNDLEFMNIRRLQNTHFSAFRIGMYFIILCFSQ